MRSPVWTLSTSTMGPWYHSTKLPRSQGLDQRIFLLPDSLDPALELLPFFTGLGDAAIEEPGRDLRETHPHDDALDTPRDGLPESDVRVRIDERDVQESIELIAERGDDEADPSHARAEQMAVRRVLVGLLF